MAKTKTIQETGPQGFRDLQEQNNLDPSKAPSWILELGKAASMSYTSTYNPAIYEPTPILTPVGNWGESMFDEPTLSQADLYDIQNTRHRNLPWYAKLGSALGNSAVLAATTFLDGTVGLLYGGLLAAGEGRFSAIWDNEFSNGMLEFNRYMESLMPYYENEDKKWYLKIVGADFLDFWANGLLKNIGFTVGALYSGAVFTKGLTAIGLANKLGRVGTTAAGALYSAINEGRIEANQNAYEMLNKGLSIIDLSYRDNRLAIEQNPNLSPEEKEALIYDLGIKRALELSNLRDLALHMGNMDMLLNIPILALDNFYTFGRLYTKGFRDARNTVVNNAKRSAKQIADATAAQEENVLASNILRGERYAWQEITKGQAIKKGLGHMLREGNEEMALAYAAEFATNLYSYDDPDTYYKALTDPNVERQTMDAISSLVKGFNDTYGNLDRWQEGAIGALTGLLGTPTFGRTLNASADTYLGRGKLIGMTGGIFGELSQRVEDNRRGLANVEWMNKLLDKVLNHKENLMLKKAFNDAMDGYAEADDKFQFLNLEDNELFRMIGSYLSSGRKQDLLDILDLNFENMTDEELAKIALVASPQDAFNADGTTNTSGWRNQATGEFVKPRSLEMQNMRNKLAAKRDKIREAIDLYEDSLATVRSISGRYTDLSESEVNELAWLLWKTKRFPERVKEIARDYADLFAIIEHALTHYEGELLEILDLKPTSTEGLNAMATALAEVSNALLKLNQEDAQKMQRLAASLRIVFQSIKNNLNAMPFLGPLLSHGTELLELIYKNAEEVSSQILNSSIDPIKFKEVVAAITDLGRLYLANQDFNLKFLEYTEDPFKLRRNRERIDLLNLKRANALERVQQRNLSDNISRERALNGLVSSKDIDDAIESRKATNTPEDAEKIAELEATKLAMNVRSKTLLDIDALRESEEYDEADLDAVESAIKNGTQKASTISADNEAFMMTEDGDPISDSLMKLVESLVNKALQEEKDLSDMKAVPEEAEKAVEEVIASEEEKKKEKEKEKEKAIETAVETGHDAVPKNAPVNDGVPPKNPTETPEKPALPLPKPEGQKRPNKGSSSKGIDTRTKAPAQPTKAQRKKAEEAAEEERRKEAVIYAAGIAISVNLPFLEWKGSNSEEFPKLILELMYLAYTLINDDKVDTVKDVLGALENSNEYKKLEGMMRQKPSLVAAIKGLFEKLDVVYYERKAEQLEEDALEQKKLEEEVGPPTQQPTSRTTNNSISPKYRTPKNTSAIAPLVSEYSRDFSTGKVKVNPHWQEEPDYWKRKAERAIHEFSLKNNIFDNAARVHEGDTVYFTVSEELNKEAGTFVIIMTADKEGKVMIGTVPVEGTKPYANNPLIAALYERIQKEYLDRNKEKPFISKETSHVLQTMAGYVRYSGSKKPNGDTMLIDVFKDNGKQLPFTIGIQVRPGAIVTSNKGGPEVVTEEESKIIPLNSDFALGTPFILIPTGEGSDQLVPVPFFTPRLDEIGSGTMFWSYAFDTIGTALLSERPSLGDGLILRKALMQLFSSNLRVSIEKDGELRIKESNGKVIFEGNILITHQRDIMRALARVKLPIRIARNLINRDKKVYRDHTYNEIIGEIAHVDVVLGGYKTVNDYFTINPLSTDGTEITGERIPYAEPRQKPAKPNSVIRIEFNDETYQVTPTNQILDKDDSPTTLSLQEQDVILAKAELARNPERIALGDSIYWFRLGNGNLFYSKKGEEKILYSLQEIDEKLQELQGKDTPALKEEPKKPTKVEPDTVGGSPVALAYLLDGTPGTIENAGYFLHAVSAAFPAITDKLEDVRNSSGPEVLGLKPDLFVLSNPEILDKLRTLVKDTYGEEGLSLLEELFKNSTGFYARDGREVGRKLEALEPKKTTTDKSDTEQKPLAPAYPSAFNTSAKKAIFDFLDKESKEKIRAMSNTLQRAVVLQLTQMAKDVKNKLNRIPKEKIQKAIDDQLKLREALDGYTPADLDKEVQWLKKALPQLSDDEHLRIARGLIKISNSGDPKYAWGMTQKGVMTLSDMAALGTTYHEAFHSVIDLLLTNQEIDDLFEAGSLKYGIPIDSSDSLLDVEENLAEDFRRYVQKEQTPIVGTLVKAFRTVKHIVLSWIGNEPYINNMFYRINRGKLANRAINNRDRGARAALAYTLEMQSIKDKAIKDGTFMKAPNGKPTKLTERLWLQVRTKAFKEWFGDWQNDPNNSSKVIDENGEPLVVYHGTPNEFTTFDISYFGTTTDWGSYGKGHYFTTELDLAKGYSIPGTWDDYDELGNLKPEVLARARIMPVFLNIRNLGIRKSLDKNPNIDGTWVYEGRLYAVRNANQIKSATDNVGTFSRSNDDIRYREVSNPESLLRTETQRFLDNFGISIRDVDNYSNDLPLFDALNRVINVRNAEDITNGVGYAVAFMMQHNPKVRDMVSLMNLGLDKKIQKAFRRSLRKRGDFALYAHKEDINAGLNLIAEEIATLLRNLYKQEFPEAPKSIVKKAWEVVTGFFEALTPSARIKFDTVVNYGRQIANSIKLNDDSIIRTSLKKPKTDTKAELVDIGKALTENPYERDIIDRLQNHNIAVAGSAAIALAGTLYRPVENPLHDIDFMARGLHKELLDVILNQEFPYNAHIRTIERSVEDVTETYLIMDRPFEVIRPMEGISVYLIVDKEGNILGSYVGSELVLNEGVNGKFLDFFAGNDSNPYGATITQINGKNYLISDYRNAMSAKIEWARPKDIWDYNNFVPNQFLRSSLRLSDEAIRQKVQNANIIWGHPAIGKTTYLQNNQNILEWDLEVNPLRNAFIRDLIDPEHRMDMKSEEFQAKKQEYMANASMYPEYLKFLAEKWQGLKERAAREGKKLFASPLLLLRMFPQDFDLVVALNERDFMERNSQRGGSYYGSLNWKQNIDEVLTRVDPNKLIYTGKYFSEFMLSYHNISEYHNLKLSYLNLDLRTKDYLLQRGISPENYNALTVGEKENTLICFI